MVDQKKLRSFYRKINPLSIGLGFLYLAIFSFPFSLRFFLLEEASFSAGLFSEWATVSVSFSQFCIWIGLLFLFFAKESFLRTYLTKEKFFLFLGIIIIFLLPLLFTNFPFVHLAQLFSFLTLAILFMLLHRGVINPKLVLKIILLSAFLQGFIAVFQFALQKSLNLTFLGEQVFDSATLGAARFGEEGITTIRSYGTFLHPNVLAGFLVMVFFWAASLPPFWRRWRYLLLLPLLFSFSITAWTAFFAGLFVYYNSWNKIWWFLLPVIFLFLLFPERLMQIPSSLDARLELLVQSFTLFIQNPLGLGFGSSALLAVTDSQELMVPWFFQPVHSFLPLLFLEGGIFLGIIVVLWTVKLFRKVINTKNQVALSALVALLVLSLFDHYLLTTFAGQFLVMITIFISLRDHTIAS